MCSVCMVWITVYVLQDCNYFYRFLCLKISWGVMWRFYTQNTRMGVRESSAKHKELFKTGNNFLPVTPQFTFSEYWLSTNFSTRQNMSFLCLISHISIFHISICPHFRSFHPFCPLLQTCQPSGVQLWAVWAIHLVCSQNSKTHQQTTVCHAEVCVLQHYSCSS